MKVRMNWAADGDWELILTPDTHAERCAIVAAFAKNWHGDGIPPGVEKVNLRFVKGGALMPRSWVDQEGASVRLVRDPSQDAVDPDS